MKGVIPQCRFCITVREHIPYIWQCVKKVFVAVVFVQMRLSTIKYQEYYQPTPKYFVYVHTILTNVTI